MWTAINTGSRNELPIPYLVPNSVHHVGRFQYQKTTLLNFDPGLSNVLLNTALSGKGFTKSYTILSLHQKRDYIMSNIYTCTYNWIINLTLSTMSWRDLSADPTSLMQWWIRPGPKRPWAISNPTSSPSGSRSYSTMSRKDGAFSSSMMNSQNYSTSQERNIPGRMHNKCRFLCLLLSWFNIVILLLWSRCFTFVCK